MKTIKILNRLKSNRAKLISSEIGVLYRMTKVPKMNLDPSMISYGIWPANIRYLTQDPVSRKVSEYGLKAEAALLGSIDKTMELYTAAFYNLDESIRASYKKLPKHAIQPNQFALFHKEQYRNDDFPIDKFTEDTELSWFPTIDLTNGKKTYLPGQFIYLPFTQPEKKITFNTPVGLVSHSNYYQAILNGLYQAIARDSFALTWLHQLVPKKLKITEEIQSYLNTHFPARYDWHFFDITYDIPVPTILGFCFGESDYGKFVAVGAAAGDTEGEALQKTIQDIGHTIAHFRHLLAKHKDWHPTNDYHLIQGFDQHSIFYTKRPDLWFIFDQWIHAEESKVINFFEKDNSSVQIKIREIVHTMKDKNYNVLVKDLTTCDVRELGFFSIKVFIPQLIALSALDAYPFLGGDRLYSVPQKLGYKTLSYPELNPYPHPSP